MFRLTVDKAKDYIGKTCLVASRDSDLISLIVDRIVSVDTAIHTEHCKTRDMVYIINMNEICSPFDKELVGDGDTGIFFDLLSDLFLKSTYVIRKVIAVSTDEFTDWPYMSGDGEKHRYFLPMKELPDGLHNI